MTQSIEADYLKRINLVFEFIDGHLESNINLTDVAEVASFSPFHFHRVFKFMTGETLNQYIVRQRIEKSALRLLHETLSVSEIAHIYGFSDGAAYSKTFKKYFGVSPSTFKEQNPNRHSKIQQLQSKIGQDYPDRQEYICIIMELKKWIMMNAEIEVKQIAEIGAIGLTHIGVDGLDATFGKLMHWAGQKGLFDNPEHKLGRVFYDSFKVTEPNKVRMNVFLTTDQLALAENEFIAIKLSSGKYIVARFEIAPDEFEKSWTGLFLWMNENGHKKADSEALEIYHTDYRKHPEQKMEVEFFIPIV